MKNRKRNRLAEYDYSNPAWYYVTICTQNHKEYFGEIRNGKMILNRTGKLVNQLWKNIEILREHIELDNNIVMPNHIHGIIIINKYVGDANFASSIQTFNVKNNHETKIADRTKMELSKIIQQFKRAATLKIRKEKGDSAFKWQRSFYDRIIRNEKELFNIRNYIELNPLRWGLDNDIENLEL